jgi:inner membrane protein
MTGRTHDLAAFTALSFIVVSHPLPEVTLGTVLAALAANMIGGIAPDIDQPTAPLWRNLPATHIFGKVFGKLVGGHRFLSHSILGLVLFGFVWKMFLLFLHPSMPTINMDIVWWAFMIGFASHLLMDTITKEGVPWLLPLPFNISFPPIKAFRVMTGGFIESFILFPGLILVNAYLYYYNYNKILELLHHHVK